MRPWNIGDTCYRGKTLGKVTGLVWPGPASIDGVVTLQPWTERSNNEAIACLVTFRGQRGPVMVSVGELTRIMPLPVRVTKLAG